jgi:hypothetical protein
MSILSAFDNLGNSLVESAATDEFKQLLAEIAEIETDIKTLQKEVSDGWTKDFKHQLSDIEDEIRKVRGDLWDIVKSYEIEEFWGYDEDGHKEYSYWTDKDKQREVAMLEATIRKKLEQVEAMHAALEKQLKQDHETAYATQTRNIRAKTTARDDKKKRKEELKSIREDVFKDIETNEAKMRSRRTNKYGMNIANAMAYSERSMNTDTGQMFYIILSRMEKASTLAELNMLIDLYNNLVKKRRSNERRFDEAIAKRYAEKQAKNTTNKSEDKGPETPRLQNTPKELPQPD